MKFGGRKPINLTKGSCYFCDKPYENDHASQLRQSQVFTIEMLGLEEVVKESVMESFEVTVKYIQRN